MSSQLFDSGNSSLIFNGAACSSYCWSQSHSDLEIRVKLKTNIRYEDVEVELIGEKIKVFIRDRWTNGDGLYDRLDNCNFITLLDGRLERAVDKDTLCWLIDSDDRAIVIYVDKLENLWWSKLLDDEEPNEIGPKNYSVMIDHIDLGSRMVIDRLVTEQRNKMIEKRDRGEPNDQF